jgi:Transglutaminase-like superfamily
MRYIATMLRHASGFSQSDNLDSVSPEARLMWQRETAQLDFNTVKVRIQATKLTQLCVDETAKAVAVHNYVQSLPLVFAPDFLRTKASDVIRLGHGDCHTKGILFVALLRALGLPARLRFVASPVRFLAGFIDTHTTSMSCALGEVFLNGRWCQTDTYVADNAFAKEARELLSREHHFAGYGLHAMGERRWEGLEDMHAHRSPADPDSMPIMDWGVGHDPEHFYADKMHAPSHHSLQGRTRWLSGAAKINRKVNQIRQREFNWANSAYQALA